MQSVCPKIGLFLANVGVQIGVGASFGMLIAKIDAKVGTILNVSGAAFVGAASGLVSGLLGGVALICLSEAEEGTVRKVLFRVGNTLLTISFASACFSVERWRMEQLT